MKEINLIYPFKSHDIFEIKNNFSKYKSIESELLYSSMTIDSPMISVVIPTYKDIYIYDAINSCINQNNAPAYEIVIVDNNSDNSDTKILEYVKKLKLKNLRYYKNNNNIGMAGNWNRCAELAKGRYLVYLHSDDLLLENSLEILWNYHNTIAPEAAIISRGRLVNGDLVPLTSNNANKRIYKNNILSLLMLDYSTGCGDLLNRSVLLSLGGWNEDLYPSFDFCLFINYQIVAPIYHISDTLKLIRIANNESFKESFKYRATRYFMQKSIVTKFFHNFFIFRYLISTQAKIYKDDLFGAKNSEYKVSFVEKVFLKIFSQLYKLTTKVTLTK